MGGARGRQRGERKRLRMTGHSQRKEQCWRNRERWKEGECFIGEEKARWKEGGERWKEGELGRWRETESDRKKGSDGDSERK